MARRYAIQKGDTLRKISRKYYDDFHLYERLAEYNGIRNPDLIMLGQVIEVPSKRELEGRISKITAPETQITPPHGLEEILSTFGNIYNFIREDGTLDPKWERRHLGRAPLPFPIPLSWDASKMVRNLYCHRELAPVFSEVFTSIEDEGLKDEIRTFGGCFNFRSKRTIGKLSTHSWGISIDLNPQTNAQGTAGNMHPDVLKIFRRFGFKWGGDWTGRSKDPMHFQFCTGY